MKIFRWSALALAVAGGAAAGCSQNGCGATPLPGTGTQATVITCGPGTSQQNGVCLPTQGGTTK